MTIPLTGGGGSAASGMRWAVAALDHGAALAGYSAVPEAAPAGGGWRRLYLKEGGAPTFAAVGAEGGAWASLGIEIAVVRDRVEAQAADLIRALAPYEVALDLDAGADRYGSDAVLRVALRLFVDGFHRGTFREAAGNVIEAAAVARRVLGV